MILLTVNTAIFHELTGRTYLQLDVIDGDFAQLDTEWRREEEARSELEDHVVWCMAVWFEEVRREQKSEEPITHEGVSVLFFAALK